MFSEGLARIALTYTHERAKPFSGSEFGDFVRNQLVTEAKKQIMFWPYDLKVKASVGAGNWAAVPWLAFFDPIITESATKGFFVVYLINAQRNTVALSLIQGATEVCSEFGDARGREVLRRRAQDIRERVSDYSSRFDCNPIDLSSEDRLPLNYMAGHAFGRTYALSELKNEILIPDLELMLEAYAALVDRGGTLPSDAMHEDAGSSDIEETRRYVLSKRIERAANVRTKVLEARGVICECCGFEPRRDFSYVGPLKNTPLDVHHAKPLKHLQEGETRRYKIPDDFLVLCPTCHRMIHRLGDLSDLDALKDKMRFKLLRYQESPI